MARQDYEIRVRLTDLDPQQVVDYTEAVQEFFEDNAEGSMLTVIGGPITPGHRDDWDMTAEEALDAMFDNN